MSSNKMSGKEEHFLTPFQVMNLCDIPEIYTKLCYSVYKDELLSNPKGLLIILERLSYINIQSESIVEEFCSVIKSKNIKDLDEFITRVSTNPVVYRKTSIFRFDPVSILSAFMDHSTKEQATYFIRYILHSAHLPDDMNSFLNEYKKADFATRDALIPKVIYSWRNIT